MSLADDLARHRARADQLQALADDLLWLASVIRGRGDADLDELPAGAIVEILWTDDALTDAELRRALRLLTLPGEES